MTATLVRKEMKITWVSMRDGSSADIDFSVGAPETTTDMEILEATYRATNMYAGTIWEIISDNLPAHRSHTALSVGDLVSIDGVTYVCADFGWELVK